ncbi:MAG: HAD family hydrolase [Chromatiales bacterium]|nr:HAD family hydrolase [Chromatiales bacterium]
MHHVMFDVDGTLVKSYDFDEACYLESIAEVLGHELDTDWSSYPHITDTGILNQHLKRIGFMDRQGEIQKKVKGVFVDKISQHVAASPVREVPGATAFIARLKTMDNVSLSIATGGWLETAKLKLDSAGIDYAGIPIASSNDHYARTEIMKIAKAKANVASDHKLTYFGDAAWDKKACSELGFNFVLVGNRVANHQAVSDLTAVDQALGFIGL